MRRRATAMIGRAARAVAIAAGAVVGAAGVAGVAGCGHGGAPAAQEPGRGAGTASGSAPAIDAAAAPDGAGDPGGAAIGDPPAPADAGAVAAASPDAAPAKTHVPPKGPPKVLQINQTGELVDVEAAVPAGYVTIVDFWATWCGGCKIAEAKFMEKIGDVPGVVVRKVDVGDGDTPVGKHYGVHGLPQVWIYDAKKRMRYVLVANDAMTAGDKALELLAETKAKP